MTNKGSFPGPYGSPSVPASSLWFLPAREPLGAVPQCYCPSESTVRALPYYSHTMGVIITPYSPSLKPYPKAWQKYKRRVIRSGTTYILDLVLVSKC